MDVKKEAPLIAFVVPEIQNKCLRTFSSLNSASSTTEHAVPEMQHQANTVLEIQDQVLKRKQFLRSRIK